MGSHLEITKKQQLKATFTLGFKVLLTSFLLFLIYTQIKERLATTLLSDFQHLFLNTQFFSIAALVISLMLVNWFLEAYKWKLLVSKIQNISLSKSFEAITSGIAIGMFTPNRIGEFAGRVMHLEDGNRMKGAITSLMGSFAQMVVTISFGALACTFFLWTQAPFSNVFLNLAIGILLLIGAFSLIFIFLSENKWVSAFRNWKFLPKRITQLLTLPEKFTPAELGITLLLSVFRFVVFNLQFLLLLWALGISISILDALMLLPIIFFVHTIIPSITLAELGVREMVSISILGLYFSNDIAIIAASSLLWIINLVLPAVFGSLFLLKTKLFVLR